MTRQKKRLIFGEMPPESDSPIARLIVALTWVVVLVMFFDAACHEEPTAQPRENAQLEQLSLRQKAQVRGEGEGRVWARDRGGEDASGR